MPLWAGVLPGSTLVPVRAGLRRNKTRTGDIFTQDPRDLQRENTPQTDRLHRGQPHPSPDPSVRSPGGCWLAGEEAAGQNTPEALRTGSFGSFEAVRLQCKHSNPGA